MTSWKHGLAWPENLSTGNEKIDTQHKTLFKITSDLIEANTNGNSKEKLGEMLAFLANYTVEHFAYEEKLMKETDYPEYAAHRWLHDDFKNTVIELVGNFKINGTSDELAQSLDNIVVSWLLNHIQREDVKIAEHVRQG